MNTRAAGADGATLTSPSVGTWKPSVGLGAPVAPGDVVGWLKRDGRWLAVTAPRTAGGAAIDVANAGDWVCFGTPLVTLGEGLVGGAAVAAAPMEAGAPEGATAVRADTDGTVYLRPDPDAPAFVSPGTAVSAQATLALVEVMKTFTPVRAPIAGTVVRVDVDDGEGVSEGQALFWIDED